MSAEAVAALESLLARVQTRAREPRPPRPVSSHVGGAAAPSAAPRAASPVAPSQRVSLPGPDPVVMDEPFGTESIKAPPSPELRAGAAPAPGELGQGYEGQRPTPIAPSVALADDDIEDYDDELIEVIEDSDPAAAPVAHVPPPAGPPTAAPRRDSPPHLVVAPSAAAPSLERHAPAVSGAEASAVQPQVVTRSTVGQSSDVVRTEGTRSTGRPETFLVLLDDSLAL